MKTTTRKLPDVSASRFRIRAFLLTSLFVLSCFTASASSVTLHNFKLTGDLRGDQARFVLTALARVEDSKGGRLELLTGRIALTDIATHPRWRVRLDEERCLLEFDRRGEFPIRLEFAAAVHRGDGWSSVEFRVAPGALKQVILQSLPEDTQFRFAGAARPERRGDEFVSFLPSDGLVNLSWKETPAETEGKLFYAAEMWSQLTVSPGLMRQTALLDFKVMQGEMSRVVLELHGPGEVTRVQGDQVLAWNVEPAPQGPARRLIVQLNQPQKNRFALQVQTQSPLGAFPLSADATRITSDGATRFAGYIRIVNEGAVRLEIAGAHGMTQISPEQFPENDLTRAALPPTGNQRFAYRFAGSEFALRVQADQILPELSVSQLAAYHHGENELSIDTEIELEIREAPLRELILRVPRGYAVAQLTAPGLSDYMSRDPADQPDSELRLIYAQPVTGRQLIQLRLERNQSLGEASWVLPRIEVMQARSVRGFVAVSSDAGFRLTPERTQALTEIATAFFPRKLNGIQTAFRLNDAAWQAAMQVERLPQTLQADVFHLFSIGEGIAYGSSVINYVVSGAPVSAFRVELSEEYFNVEFTGRDIRNWQRTPSGYVVQLHTPVSGPYTLLATCERPFRAQGETLAFTGARPLDAQSEQGHTVIISAHQFEVQPANVSTGLLPLETGEVPPEYRLLFDAPILAAYRYSSRPFNLELALTPLAQGDSLNQVVDRASLATRISKEGQILTDARYFVKSRGNPHFRVTLPSGTQLWSATVNGAPVVPVTDARGNLIPLPQQHDPDAVADLELKLAARSEDPKRVTVAAPVLAAPVMLVEWTLSPDAGRRLVYRTGSLTPARGLQDRSGFANLLAVFNGREGGSAWRALIAALGLTGIGLVVWRWTAQAAIYRRSARHLTGLALGMASGIMALVCLLQLGGLAHGQTTPPASDVIFVAPVQQSGSALTAEVSNLPETPRASEFVGFIWPVLLGIAAWICAWRTAGNSLKAVFQVAGWTLLAMTALRLPNGAEWFFRVIALFLVLNVFIPSVRRVWQLPPKPEATPAAGASPSPAVTAWLIGGLAGLSVMAAEPARAADALSNSPTAYAITNEVRVEDGFAFGTARIQWRAAKGDSLPILLEPAVLTRIQYPPRSLKLIPGSADSKVAQQLLASSAGLFEIEIAYQIQVTQGIPESSMTLPIPAGLINRLELTVAGADVEVVSPNAVSIQRETQGSNTVAIAILSPAQETRVAWKPRSRDVRRERPVFYAEWSQVYVPSAGVIEGVHHASIRPAQGELAELVFVIPPGATITDVTHMGGSQSSAGAAPPLLWRFDPDTRQLRVTFATALSRPFALQIRSQIASGPLPFEQSAGLIRVENAAGQIGMLGIATGNEIQLDSVAAEGFSPVNLEDFSAGLLAPLQAQVSGLTLRRAFRYSNTGAAVGLRASAVEPDVRVESQDTLSLGEDRVLLAANLTVDITRAGIFRLSFVLPDGFDVESVSGSLSHWTESRSGTDRVITLHLPGKTEGRQQFAVSLAAAGLKSATGWAAPQLIVREAAKQRGTLLIVPEQGMRLQVADREGMTQLDPQQSGVRQKGVMAFRVLQTPSRLALDIEQVEPWIQVTSLQHASVTDGQVRIAANLQYQIENTGLKAFRVRLPADAEGVAFRAEQLADFLPVSGAPDGLREWEVRLDRRVIGTALLQVSYHTPVPEAASEITLHGIEVAGVNLQRGFVTVESGVRLQASAEPPPALQPAEWQSIPRALQQDLRAASAHFTYRLVEPAFTLPLRLERREAAKLLPARVMGITLNSVVSDHGEMLTQVKLDILPGDKRLLNLRLPEGARYWFAFVNQNGVWPWREGDRILIPLDQLAPGEKAVPVELFYSCKTGAAQSKSLDLALLAPKFDLPLENIVWNVAFSEKWKTKRWSGSLQLTGETAGTPAAIDLSTYLQSEAEAQREKSREAESFLTFGNRALEKGDPRQARRAFQAAYGLSSHDIAFNEDARVQLHNVKLQQALVGLNVRQAAVAGNLATLGARFRDLPGRKEVIYTQQDAKNILDRNTADDNAAFLRLAERIVQQQDAAVSSASALRASIPNQGRILTFQRALAVDTWADLAIHVEAVPMRTVPVILRIAVLIATGLGLLVLVLISRGTARVTR